MYYTGINYSSSLMNYNITLQLYLAIQYWAKLVILSLELPCNYVLPNKLCMTYDGHLYAPQDMPNYACFTM